MLVNAARIRNPRAFDLLKLRVLLRELGQFASVRPERAMRISGKD